MQGTSTADVQVLPARSRAVAACHGHLLGPDLDAVELEIWHQCSVTASFKGSTLTALLLSIFHDINSLTVASRADQLFITAVKFAR